jgi:hypothetical protein
MHWPFPPNPPEYESPGLGLLVALFAIVLIFLVVVFYAARSSASQLHEPEPAPDETAIEEERRQ